MHMGGNVRHVKHLAGMSGELFILVVNITKMRWKGMYDQPMYSSSITNFKATIKQMQMFTGIHLYSITDGLLCLYKLSLS